jgi:hypothetical protein
MIDDIAKKEDKRETEKEETGVVKEDETEKERASEETSTPLASDEASPPRAAADGEGERTNEATGANADVGSGEEELSSTSAANKNAAVHAHDDEEGTPVRAPTHNKECTSSPKTDAAEDMASAHGAHANVSELDRERACWQRLEHVLTGASPNLLRALADVGVSEASGTLQRRLGAYYSWRGRGREFLRLSLRLGGAGPACGLAPRLQALIADHFLAAAHPYLAHILPVVFEELLPIVEVPTVLGAPSSLSFVVSGTAGSQSANLLLTAGYLRRRIHLLCVCVCMTVGLSVCLWLSIFLAFSVDVWLGMSGCVCRSVHVWLYMLICVCLWCTHPLL